MATIFTGKTNRFRTAGALLGIGLCGVALAAGEAVAIDLPVTIEKVWFRPGHQTGAVKIKKLSGPLTIDEAGLEIVGKKDSVHIPIESISMVWLGKFGRDVDTEWVLLQLEENDKSRVVGIRDGRVLGYGQGTRELFETIGGVMKGLSAAQYRVEPGYRIFDQISFQMTLSVPQSWSHYIHSAVTIGDRPAQGTIIFSVEPIDRMADHDEVLERVLTGETAGFYLDRTDPGKGPVCDGLSAGQSADLLERAGRELRAGGFEIVEAPELTEFTIARCRGVRVVGRSRHEDGRAKLADLRVVSDGETLFVFGLLSPADGWTELHDTFERVIAGTKIAVSP